MLSVFAQLGGGRGPNEGEIGMLQCLGLELYVVEVLGWRGEGLRLTAREVSRAVGVGGPDLSMWAGSYGGGVEAVR